MFKRIRLRLTISYVGILALILLVFGVVVVTGFSREVTAQQDEFLTQLAVNLAERVPVPPPDPGGFSRPLAQRRIACITPERKLSSRPPKPRSPGSKPGPTATFWKELHWKELRHLRHLASPPPNWPSRLSARRQDSLQQSTGRTIACGL